MELDLQYKIIKMVGKNVILPMFLNCVGNISKSVFTLKKSVEESNLKKEIEETDLEYKLATIMVFLNEISDDYFNSQTIHTHLCGIYEVMENIERELLIVNTENDYIKTSWYHYTIGWMYFNSKINMTNIKKYIKLLDSRYDQLIKVLMVYNKSSKE
jgi:hypothetical protein